GTRSSPWDPHRVGKESLRTAVGHAPRGRHYNNAPRRRKRDRRSWPKDPTGAAGWPRRTVTLPFLPRGGMVPPAGPGPGGRSAQRRKRMDGMAGAVSFTMSVITGMATFYLWAVKARQERPRLRACKAEPQIGGYAQGSCDDPVRLAPGVKAGVAHCRSPPHAP